MLDLALVAALLIQEPAAEPVEDEAIEPVSEAALSALSDLPASLDEGLTDDLPAALAASQFARLGREDLLARFYPDAYTYQACPIVEGDPLQTAITAAGDAQIVIINEAATQPFHRFVMGQLAEGLAGDFNVFAAEAFNYLRLMEPRAPGALGWLDQEAVFGRVVREIEADGYRLVAFEIRAAQRDPNAVQNWERLRARANAQVDNLIAEVLEEDPDARILIHIGHGGISELPLPDLNDIELTGLAAQLRARTGIDPLTISQTHCTAVTERAASPAQSGLQDAAVVTEDADGRQEGGPGPSTHERVDLEPGRFALVDGSHLLPDGAVDLFLAHGPMSFTDHRPDWRRTIGDVSVDIPEAYLTADQPVIVEARLPDQGLAHTPMDRVLIYPGETPVLLLPPGGYVLTAWTREGALGEAQTVTVQ